MNILNNCQNIFIDFDGVVVDSNKFKEKAIEKSIFELAGKTKISIDALNYFNINAGISRYKKLSMFFNSNDVKEIMKIYEEECYSFFKIANPTIGLKKFLHSIKIKKNFIKFYILSGGEKGEIEMFLKKNQLLKFFEDILASEKTKSNHLRDCKASENDIFIGDSQNDLKVSIQSGLKFVLFEQYKSLMSFPSQELIDGNVYIRTKNFQTLKNNLVI